MNLAAQFADRVVLMKDGVIRYDGTPQAVFIPDRIRKVFEARVAVETDRFSGRPRILPQYHHHGQSRADTSFTLPGGE
jgi:iron complex transport system ATP-binding protein